MAPSDHNMDYLDEVGFLLNCLPRQPIQGVVDAILTVYKYGRRIYVFGKGSAGLTAAHFAWDLQQSMIVGVKPHFGVVTLTNLATLFPGVDDGREPIIEERLPVLLNPGDLVIALATSGRSSDILDALKYASLHGAITVAFTGDADSGLMQLADYCVVVPGKRITQIEDVHVTVCHLIVDAVQHTLSERSSCMQEHRMSRFHTDGMGRN